MKKLLLFLISVSFVSVCMAQSAKEELENGLRVGSEEKLFLYFSDDGSMKISIDKNSSNPVTHRDSTLFLIKNVGVNVYMRPVNPLRIITKERRATIDDPGIAAAEETLNSMMSFLGSLITTADTTVTKETEDSLSDGKSIKIEEKLDSLYADVGRISEIITEIEEFVRIYKEEADSLNKRLDEISNRIQNKRQKEIKKLFNVLKELDFKHQKPTVDSLTEIESELSNIKKHYSDIDSLIKGERENMDSTNILLNYISGLVLNEMEVVKNGQFKTVKAFEQLFEMVNTYVGQATQGADGVEWVVPLGDISPAKGKITTLSVELFGSTYSYDEETHTIREVSSSSIGAHSIRVKRYNRFVPEVVFGTVFTFIEHPVYGTSTDNDGNQVVVKARNEEINNLNISGMINFNYFLSNSPVHPLLQIGLGINNEIPTLLVGSGGRII